MIWTYFPTGMCFPTASDDAETKRACWYIALRALAAVEHLEMQLYEATLPCTPAAGESAYFCILCHRNISKTRENNLAWKQMDRLRCELLYEHPFWQANELEPYAPFTLLGTVNEDGAILPTEEGKHLLPSELPSAMERNTGETILLVADRDKQTLVSAWKRLSAEGKRVAPLLLTDGGIGTVYAWTTACGGRWEPVLPAYQTEGFCRFGVLFGHTAVIEPAHPSVLLPSIKEALSFVADSGYRSIVIAAGDLPFDKEMWKSELIGLPSEITVTVLLKEGTETETCQGVRFEDGVFGMLSRMRVAEKLMRAGKIVLAGGSNETSVIRAFRRLAKQTGVPIALPEPSEMDSI